MDNISRRVPTLPAPVCSLTLQLLLVVVAPLVKQLLVGPLVSEILKRATGKSDKDSRWKNIEGKKPTFVSVALLCLKRLSASASCCCNSAFSFRVFKQSVWAAVVMRSNKHVRGERRAW